MKSPTPMKLRIQIVAMAILVLAVLVSLFLLPANPASGATHHHHPHQDTSQSQVVHLSTYRWREIQRALHHLPLNRHGRHHWDGRYSVRHQSAINPERSVCLEIFNPTPHDFRPFARSFDHGRLPPGFYLLICTHHPNLFRVHDGQRFRHLRQYH